MRGKRGQGCVYQKKVRELDRIRFREWAHDSEQRKYRI